MENKYSFRDVLNITYNH